MRKGNRQENVQRAVTLPRDQWRVIVSALRIIAKAGVCYTDDGARIASLPLTTVERVMCEQLAEHVTDAAVRA